jgi:hypothetical protein
MERHIELTVRGERLDQPVAIKEGSYTYETDLPDEAFPDCETCEKVELYPENIEVANCYAMLIGQQERSAMSGHRLGLRMEALVSFLGWMERQGTIENPDIVMRRIWILDEVYNRIQNGRMDAESEKRSKK